MVLSILDGKYYELHKEHNHFYNYEIEFPINWITYENRYSSGSIFKRFIIYYYKNIRIS